MPQARVGDMDAYRAFLGDVDRLEIPRDLADGLDAAPGARAAFDGFAPSSRHSILEWIKQARRLETRAGRIFETARLAALGLRASRPKDR